MKRILIVISIFILALTMTLSLTPTTALAETGTFLLIDRDNVSLYADTRKAPALFTLPRTYYVKVLELNYDENYHRVEYNGIEGLVKISEVSSKTETNVQDPYYTAQNIAAHISTHLYKRPSFADSEDSGITAYGLSLPYLGKIAGEKGTYGTSTWFAVSYSDQIYYIHAAMTENLDLLETTIPAHPNSVVLPSSEGGQSKSVSDEAEPKNSVDVVRVLLIISIFVPIIIILIVLLRPRKKHARNKGDRAEEEGD